MDGLNYRITTRVRNHKYLHEPETLYELREVYYDGNGDIVHISEVPEITARSFTELHSMIVNMLDGCDKPVIDYNTGEETENK